MNQKPLFYEKQKFTQWWLWLIIVGANSAIVFTSFKKMPNDDFTFNIFIFNSIIVVAIILLFFFMSLETTITKEGIYIKYFPFHWKKRFYPFEEIKELEVVKYSPIGDYGGWGVRYGRDGKAFNVKGENGLKLHFSNRKPLLIGTQKPEELKKILEPLFTINQL